MVACVTKARTFLSKIEFFYFLSSFSPLSLSLSLSSPLFLFSFLFSFLLLTLFQTPHTLSLLLFLSIYQSYNHTHTISHTHSLSPFLPFLWIFIHTFFYYMQHPKHIEELPSTLQQHGWRGEGTASKASFVYYAFGFCLTDVETL